MGEFNSVRLHTPLKNKPLYSQGHAFLLYFEFSVEGAGGRACVPSGRWALDGSLGDAGHGPHNRFPPTQVLADHLHFRNEAN